MDKSEYSIFADWFKEVPTKWWSMIIILIALVGATAMGIKWVIDKGLEWWWILLYCIVIFLFVLFSYLTYRKKAMELNKILAKIKQPKEQQGVRETSLQEKDQKCTDSASSCLIGVLDSDRSLNKRVYARDYLCDFSGISQKDRYIDVKFTLINAAVFPILLKGIKERLWVNGDECGQFAELICSPRVPHAESANITIRQRLSKEMADSIIGGKPPIMVKLSLKKCPLVIQPEIPGEEVIPIDVKMGNEFIVRWDTNSPLASRMEDFQS